MSRDGTSPATSASPSPMAGSMAGPALGALRRVAILAPSGAAVRRLASGLIATLVAHRHGVLCIAAAMTDAEAAALEALGATHRPWPPSPTTLRFLPGRGEGAALARALTAYAPHAVLILGTAMAAEATAAARRVRVARTVVLLDDLPEATDRDVPQALAAADHVVVPTAEHARGLIADGWLAADAPRTVLPGAGVDLARFATTPLPPIAGGFVFLMLAAPDRVAAALDYCAAARQVAAKAPSARFELAAPAIEAAGGFDAQVLAACGGTVRCHGALADHRAALAGCHAMVYPSYGDGVPPPLLEALATGRPVVTSDVPGCREAVDERVNGWLVAPGDVAGLAAAMEGLLKRPDLLPHMARASRIKAERRFDRHTVEAAMLDILGIGATTGGP